MRHTIDYGGLPEYILAMADEKAAECSAPPKLLNIAQNPYKQVDELYRHLPIGILLVNQLGNIEYLNRQMKRLLMIDKHYGSLKEVNDLGRLHLTHSQKDGLFHVAYPNGMTKWLEADCQMVTIGKATLIQFTFLDRSPLQQSEDAFKLLKERCSAFMPYIDHPLFLLSKEGICLDSASSNSRIFDIDINVNVGKHLHEFLPTNFAGTLLDAIAPIHPGKGYKFTYSKKHTDVPYAYEITLHGHTDDSIVCMVKDISEINTMVRSIEYLNKYDSLTDVFNRDHFDRILSTMGEPHNSPLGIYAVTLSGLTRYQRKAERGAAEDLIMETALAIKHACSQHDIPCRVGWDAFVVFLPNSTDTTIERFEASFKSSSDRIAPAARKLMVSISERHCLVEHREDQLMNVVQQLLG